MVGNVEISLAKQEELIEVALTQITGKFSRRQCFLKGFEKGLVLTLFEIERETKVVVEIPKNRRDQLRRVAWNDNGSLCVKGNATLNFRIGFLKGLEVALKEYEKFISS